MLSLRGCSGGANVGVKMILLYKLEVQLRTSPRCGAIFLSGNRFLDCVLVEQLPTCFNIHDLVRALICESFAESPSTNPTLMDCHAWPGQGFHSTSTVGSAVGPIHLQRKDAIAGLMPLRYRADSDEQLPTRIGQDGHT